ncbi:MAG TPA: family 10 glycosylhydrolase [bacterium]|nr:family 10 glycosylhydrolase [bacterium]
MKKFVLLSVLIFSVFQLCSNSKTKNTGLRGVWLTNVDSKVLDSRENIAEAMQFLAEHNFNIVFPVVWNNGRTLYPSQVMEETFGVKISSRFAGRDPLKELIIEAHKNGLAVIPWFEYGFSSSHNKDGGLIIEKKPDWAARDRQGNLLKKNGFEWMNAYHPEVQEFILNLLTEVANNYNVDGIQGDDRLPAQPVEGGYSDYTKKLYAEEHNGQRPTQDFRNQEWKQWRADKLSDFAERVYKKIKAIDSKLIVSWAPSIYPWSKDEYLQDWPEWYRRGAGDIFHPQVYRRKLEDYKQAFQTLSSENLKIENSSKIIYPGILMNLGDWVMDVDYLLKAVKHNRNNNINGEVYFFYEGLRKNNDQLADTLFKTVYSKPVQLPFKPVYKSK